MRSSNRKLEIHAWKSGRRDGVLAIDMETGVAVIVSSERTPQRNQKVAVERLEALLSEALSPAGWIR